MLRGFSTVTRAYQLLKSHGLIRREDPGRNPNNPFCQATAITEVRLPREFISEFAQSPNRSSRPRLAQASSAQIPTYRPPQHTGRAAYHPASTATKPRGYEGMWGRVSDTERARFFTASRDRLTTLEFDPDTRLTAEDRAQILAQLAQFATARPTPTALAERAQAVFGPRRLSVLEFARTRKRFLDTVPAAAAPELLRQVMWAVEQGALAALRSPAGDQHCAQEDSRGRLDSNRIACRLNGCVLQHPRRAALHNK